MPAVRRPQTIILLLLAEPSEAHSDLNRVDTGVWGAQSGIRNVHEPDLRAPIVLAAQKMQSQRSGCREVHSGRPGRNLRVGEKRTPAKVHIWSHAVARRKIPFQRKGIQANSVSRAVALGQQEYRHYIHGILESTTQRA